MTSRLSTDKDYLYQPIFNSKIRSVQHGGVDSLKDGLDEIDRLLQLHNLPYALLWLWGTWESDLSNAQIADYLEKTPSYEAIAVGTAIHEAFHFFIQVYPASGKSWTNFRSNVSDEDLQQCYVGTPVVKEIHRQEMLALLSAFTSNDRDQTIDKIREFLHLRTRRYAQIPSITIRDWKNREHTVSCKDAEARHELHEGVPQFTQNALILDLHLGTREQIAHEVLMITNYYLDTTTAEGQRPIHSYYHTGSISLLLIRKLFDGNFLDLTREISQPDSEFVITDILAGLVGIQ